MILKNSLNLSYNPAYSADYIDAVGGLKKSAFSELIVIDPDKKSYLCSTYLIDLTILKYIRAQLYMRQEIGKVSV